MMASNVEIAFALHHAGPGATVMDIAPLFPFEEQKNLSSRLCKMRDVGLCVAERVDGKNQWTLTNKGLRELGTPLPQKQPEPTPAVVLEPEPTPEPEPEFVSELEYEPDSPDPIARDLMGAMELELALDDLRQRLRAPIISARAARVYREVLSVLPPIVQDALEPLTQIVGAPQ